MPSVLEEIKKKLLRNSSPEAAAASKKFVPGDIKVFGVRMPVLNEMGKQYKSGGFELVQALWQQGTLEEQILAIKILQHIAKKDPARALQLVQAFAPGISNWAVCDAMGMQALQGIRKTHTKEIFALAQRYNHADSLWERRLSLVLVEWYTRDASLHAEINRLIKPLENDKEYYVKKAVVWIKKNFEKGKQEG